MAELLFEIKDATGETWAAAASAPGGTSAPVDVRVEACPDHTVHRLTVALCEHLGIAATSAITLQRSGSPHALAGTSVPDRPPARSVVSPRRDRAPVGRAAGDRHGRWPPRRPSIAGRAGGWGRRAPTGGRIRPRCRPGDRNRRWGHRRSRPELRPSAHRSHGRSPSSPSRTGRSESSRFCGSTGGLRSAAVRVTGLGRRQRRRRREHRRRAR